MRCHAASTLGALTGLQQLWTSAPAVSRHAARGSLGALTGLQQLDLERLRKASSMLPESLGALTGLQQLRPQIVAVSSQRCQSRWAR